MFGQERKIPQSKLDFESTYTYQPTQPKDITLKNPTFLARTVRLRKRQDIKAVE